MTNFGQSALGAGDGFAGGLPSTAGVAAAAASGQHRRSQDDSSRGALAAAASRRAVPQSPSFTSGLMMSSSSAEGASGRANPQLLPTTVEVAAAHPSVSAQLGGAGTQHEETPEVHVYKKRFSSEILCAAMWGVNLLLGLDTGLSLLDRSGEGKGE